MPIEIKEYVPNQVLYSYYRGEISDTELFAMDRSVEDFLDRTTSPLEHMLTDVRDMIRPAGLSSLMKMKCGRHPKLGWVILFGIRNPAIKFVLMAAASMFKVRIRHFNTFEESIEFLQSVDGTLPDLNATEYRQNAKNIISVGEN